MIPEEDEENGHMCPLCGSQLVPLGQLGMRVHARCRGCGMDFSWEVENV